MMLHLALSDKSGRSVAVEYVNNEMSVAETPVVTNFYLTREINMGLGQNSLIHDMKCYWNVCQNSRPWIWRT